ncbi:MAG: hypothetical protein HY303_06210 [Candidatus Wallbacteria bacterium]|nr:hypothetical protein [Candidatus Wallbacteria bacterium]
MVSVPARPGGRSRTYLRDPRSGVSIEAQPWECELWELMTGTRSVRDLLAAGLLSPEPIGPEQLGSALLRFEKAGFLDGSESSRSPGPRLAYAAGLPELGLAGRRAVGTVAALALAALMAGFWFTLEQLRHTGMGLVFPGVSPLWAVLAAWLFEWFRWACQALTASACGFRLPRAGVDLRILLPLPYLDLSRLELADRRHQVYVALAGLLSPLSAAAALCALKPWTASPVVAGLAAPAAAMALLFVALDASPLFEWNGYRLYRAAFDRELVRDHALAFFARRLFVSAPKDEKPSEEERRLSLYGLAVLAWVVGALRLATGAFRVSSVPLALAIFQAGSIPVQTLLLGMLLLSAGLLGYGVLQVLLVPVALLGERVQKEALSRLTVPAAVLASAAGLLWDSPPVQVLLLALYSLLVIVIWNRSRAAFRGMPMVYGLDLLVLFLGLRAVLLVPWVLLETACGPACSCSRRHHSSFARLPAPDRGAGNASFPR